MAWNHIIGHDRSKQFLIESLSRSQVAHAYLFFGEESIGKAKVALEFAKTLQCEGNHPVESCGDCRSCVMIESGQHPDVITIQPDGSQIKIDQIREIQKKLMYKPYSGRKKVLILDEADSMNLEAANSFLKTLEEPPDHSLILVVTSRPHRLPGTILSRCQQVRFDVPSSETLALVLVKRRQMSKPDATLLAMLCMGRIGTALTTDLNVLRSQRDIALSLVSREALLDLDTLFRNAQTHSEDFESWFSVLNWIEIWTRDLLVAQASADTGLLVNQDLKEQLSDLSQRLSTASLLGLMNMVNAFQRSVQRNLNRTMALEMILLELRRQLVGAPG